MSLYLYLLFFVLVVLCTCCSLYLLFSILEYECSSSEAHVWGVTCAIRGLNNRKFRVAMGVFFSKIFQKLIAKEPMRILMIGLDAAGKTTIL